MSILEELHQIGPANTTPGLVVNAGECRIENNDWGASGHQHNQAVFTDMTPEPGKPRGGWYWDYPTNHGGVMGSPEIIFGKKPWMFDSSCVKFPRPLEEAFGAYCEFGIRSEAKGEYNTAFDLWLTRSANKQSTEHEVSDIAWEIMIWTQQQGSKSPAGVQIAGGAEYEFDVWLQRPAEKWGILTYRRRELMTDGVMPFGLFLKDFLSRGLTNVGRSLVKEPLFLSSVSLLNEVWSGAGVAIIDRYDVKGL